MKNKSVQVAVPFILLLLFCFVVAFFSRMSIGPTVSSVMGRGGTETEGTEVSGTSEKKAWTGEDLKKVDDRQGVYADILAKAERGLFAGHAADAQFLAWVDVTYGEKVIDAVANQLAKKNGKGKKTAAGDETTGDEADVTDQSADSSSADGVGHSEDGNSADGNGQSADDSAADGNGQGQDGDGADGTDQSTDGGETDGIDQSEEDDDPQALQVRVNISQPSDYAIWREQTGKSMHVLWTEYCRKYGYESYSEKNLRKLKCKDKNLVRLDFIGDLNLADEWCTMKKLKKSKSLEKCISKELIGELNVADLTMANNEFTFGDKGKAIKGKDYTFRAKAENVEILKKLGVDMVSLANNHSYDFGEKALAETKKIIEEAEITAIGAGEDQEHAREPGTIIANGWKIGIVTATEVERFSNYTREATDTQAGVFKMTDPKNFIQSVREAKAENDFVIAYVHWGQEGESQYSSHQHQLAEQIVEAGADLIIGGHPHRLQGMEFIGEVPVIYSLGNFWFSDSALFTVAAQVAIDNSGHMELRMIPLFQERLKTGIIKDKKLLTRYYKYFADMSTSIAVDARGKVYNLVSEKISAKNILSALSRSKLEWYTTGKGYSRHNSGRDIYGNAIDVVGNLQTASETGASEQ